MVINLRFNAVVATNRNLFCEALFELRKHLKLLRGGVRHVRSDVFDCLMQLDDSAFCGEFVVQSVITRIHLKVLVKLLLRFVLKSIKSLKFLRQLVSAQSVTFFYSVKA